MTSTFFPFFSLSLFIRTRRRIVRGKRRRLDFVCLPGQIKKYVRLDRVESSDIVRHVCLLELKGRKKGRDPFLLLYHGDVRAGRSAVAIDFPLTGKGHFRSTFRGHCRCGRRKASPIGRRDLFAVSSILLLSKPPPSVSYVSLALFKGTPAERGGVHKA